MKSKYGNQKVRIGGETFDSQKEYQRYCELKLLQRAGKISDLKRQVVYELIPPQYIFSKLVERKVVYIADFVYEKDGKTIVEDAKGFRTDVYKLKRKLMLHVHGIQIREV